MNRIRRPKRKRCPRYGFSPFFRTTDAGRLEYECDRCRCYLPEATGTLLARSSVHDTRPDLSHKSDLLSLAALVLLSCRHAERGNPPDFGEATVQRHDPDVCLDLLEAAIRRCGCPGILNTHEGSQFTNTALDVLLQQHTVRLAIEGKDTSRDNCVVERLWNGVRYEEGYRPRVPFGHSGSAGSHPVLHIMQLSPVACRAGRPDTGYDLFRRPTPAERCRG